MIEILVWLTCGFIILLNWMFSPALWIDDCGNSIAMFFINIAITFAYIGALLFRVIQIVYLHTDER